MIIHNITDLSAFFKTLDNCDGNVTLVTPDGSAYDWRTHRTFLLPFLQDTDRQRYRTLEVKASSGQDVSRLICYMLEGNLQNRGWAK